MEPYRGQERFCDENDRVEVFDGGEWQDAKEFYRLMGAEGNTMNMKTRQAKPTEHNRNCFTPELHPGGHKSLEVTQPITVRFDGKDLMTITDEPAKKVRYDIHRNVCVDRRTAAAIAYTIIQDLGWENREDLSLAMTSRWLKALAADGEEYCSPAFVPPF